MVFIPDTHLYHKIHSAGFHLCKVQSRQNTHMGQEVSIKIILVEVKWVLMERGNGGHFWGIDYFSFLDLDGGDMYDTLSFQITLTQP